MLEIRADQYDRLQRDAMDRQARVIARRFAAEIQPEDAELAAKVLAYANGDEIDFLDRLLRLTKIEQYQRFLLLIFVQADLNIFVEAEFRYVLEHPLLSGDAKARHIATSAFSILQRSQ